MNFLKVLMKRNTALLLGAQTVSTMGSIMQTVALSLYVLKVGTGAQFASVLAVGMVPRLLGPVSGVLADRVNRKHMLVALDLVAGALMMAFLLFHQLGGGLTLPVIYALVLALGLIQAFYDPTVYAILPDIVAGEELENVNGASSTISNAAYIGIPALAGVLYPLIGLAWVMAVNAASFFAAAAMEGFLQYRASQRHIEHPDTEPLLFSIRRGIAAVLGSRELVLIVVISILANLALNPIFTVGIPYIMNVELRVQPGLYGLTQSLIFVGPVLGSLFAGAILKRIDYKRLIPKILGLDCVLVAAIAYVTVLARSTATTIGWWYLGVAGIVLLAFVIVATMALASIALITAMQRAVPDRLLGRVSGVVTSASVAAIPAGQWLFGGGLSLTDAVYTCLFFAAIVLIAAIVSYVCYQPLLAQTVQNEELSSPSHG